MLRLKNCPFQEGKTTCGLCSRLRRGTLYAFAEKIGATKIALGHHRDDIVETLFLNLFHGDLAVIAVAVLTTALGFGVNVLSSIELIRDFALASTLAILANGIITVTLVPLNPEKTFITI